MHSFGMWQPVPALSLPHHLSPILLLSAKIDSTTPPQMGPHDFYNPFFFHHPNASLLENVR